MRAYLLTILTFRSNLQYFASYPSIEDAYRLQESCFIIFFLYAKFKYWDILFSRWTAKSWKKGRLLSQYLFIKVYLYGLKYQKLILKFIIHIRPVEYWLVLWFLCNFSICLNIAFRATKFSILIFRCMNVWHELSSLFSSIYFSF